MPENDTASARTAKREFVKQMQRTGAIDFEQIGELVKRLPDNVLEPGSVAEDDDDGGDHVIHAVESVLHISEVGTRNQLKVDEVANLRDLNTRFSGLRR